MGEGPSKEEKRNEAKRKADEIEAKRQAEADEIEAKRQAALEEQKKKAKLAEDKRKAELAKKVVPIKQNNQWERRGERLDNKKNENNEVKVYKGTLRGSWEKIVVMKMVNHK